LAGSLLLSAVWVLEEVRELLVGGWGEASLSPEIRSEETVGLGDSVEGSLDEVSKSLGATAGSSVDIFNTSELEDLLRDTGSDNAGTSGSRDKTDTDGSGLTGNL